MNTYKTINDALQILLECGTISKVDMQMVLDAHENEKAEWRNKMIHLVSKAYDAGTKHSGYERDELIEDIRKGACDV